MEYYVYKLKFKTPVHIGNGTLSGSEAFIMADTLFSALCCESQSPEEIENLAERARERKLIFSDAMPFIGDEMYIPKPMTEPKNKDDGNSIMKKAYKKLKYIPISALDTYMSGKIEPLKENEKFKNFGKFDIRTMSSSLDEEKSKTGDMLPFSVGIYNFKENSGLYVIAGFAAADDKNLFDKLLKSLMESIRLIVRPCLFHIFSSFKFMILISKSSKDCASCILFITTFGPFKVSTFLLKVNI